MEEVSSYKEANRLLGAHDDEVFGRVGAGRGFADDVGRVRQMVAQAKHAVAADLILTGREGQVRAVGENRADARGDVLERNAVVRGDARRSDRRVDGGDDGQIASVAVDHVVEEPHRDDERGREAEGRKPRTAPDDDRAVRESPDDEDDPEGRHQKGEPEAEADGQPIQTTAEATNIPKGILQMVLGCFAVYSALFATGYYLYGSWLPAVILTVVFAVSASALVLTIVKKAK